MYMLGGAHKSTFSLIKDDNQAYYTYADGVWKFKGATQNVGFWLGSDNFSYQREMLVTDYIEPIKKYRPASVENMNKRFILVKEPKYLPHLWREAWFLPSNKVIEENIQFMHEIIFLTEKKE